MILSGGRVRALLAGFCGVVLLATTAQAPMPEPGPMLPASAIPPKLPTEAILANTLPPKPDGLWLMDDDVVLDIYHCGLMVCGRIVWMRKPKDSLGRPDIDNHNPDPALRPRLLCNTTIIDGLQPDGSNAWKDGRVYDPRTGSTYSVDASFEKDGTVHARIYEGLTILGETKILNRVARAHGDGWC